MKKFLFPTVLSFAAAISLNAAVVATVDGENIEDSDVEALVSVAAPNLDASKMPADMKKNVINDLINRKLLVKEAKASGIEKEEEFTKAMQAVRDNVALDLYMKKIYDGIKVTDAELKAFYDKNKDRFNQPAAAKASHILVENEKDANDIIAQLKNLKGDALAAKFAEIAKAKSIDKGSAANGGELGWFGQTQMVKPFGDAVFAMSKGEVSKKPVKSNFGYHVILKEDSKAAGLVPFDQVKPQIENAVKMEKFQASVKQKGDALRSKAKIEYK